MEDEAKSLAKFISENPYPVLRISKDGTLLYANAASVPFLMDWNCRIGESVPEEWKQLTSRVIQAAFRESVELEHKGQFFHFVVVPLKDADYVNVYGLDITENKRAWEKIRQAYTELKETQSQLIQAEKMHVVGRLASGVAHEVKNPLGTLLQGIEYLLNKCKDCKKEKDIYPVLKMMEEAIGRADSVIRGLLDFSRVSEMKIALEDLNSVIESALQLMRHQFNQYHIEVIKEIVKDIPKIAIDRNKIEQVFVNIFLNAIYAMPEGGKLVIKTYSRKLKSAGSKTQIIAEIVDEGTGIPEDILDKVFDPFFTTRRKLGGSGLGLSIVHNIIESHRAGIGIRNNDNRGATVTIIFSL